MKVHGTTMYSHLKPSNLRREHFRTLRWRISGHSFAMLISILRSNHRYKFAYPNNPDG